MARNEIHADAPPEAVFEVLADPRLYASWVVGASTVRRVDGPWPQVGATLYHSQLGIIHDTTEVLECEPNRRILLEARARPVVVACVDVRLEGDGDGTRIVMEEWPKGGLAAAVPRALSDLAVQARNAVAIRRLRDLAEMGVQLGRVPSPA